MSDSITVTGVVGSDPRSITTAQGLSITSFRLATRRRFFDRAAGAWQDGDTNWYTVSAFRTLALNVGASVRKGERVVVHGRLKQRQWAAGEKSGTAVEIDADTIGHDLLFGITQLRRVQRDRDDAQTDASGGAVVPSDESDPTAEAGFDAHGADSLGDDERVVGGDDAAFGARRLGYGDEAEFAYSGLGASIAEEEPISGEDEVDGSLRREVV
ncbi:single-stranded DNA-binding protein [Agromyces sp. LHK192]|uniref:single-stranded DNA-binding protein n=1 Tax=Agromyces sp. LHK192 TaxID=2498704 RepID=UPI000FD75130|nr:single-stranded DNA-binding protein [Agromyces sp. LHK192]